MPTSRPPGSLARVTNGGSYYRSLGGGRYRSTEHAAGAWGADEQHMGPVSGLLTEVIERHAPRTDLLTSRIAFDILGVIPSGEVEVTVSVIRPGRTIELIEAEVHAGGRTVVRATAWRLATSDTADLAATGIDPMPGPDQAEHWPGSQTWGGGFIRSLEIRRLPGWQPGRGRVWISTAISLMDELSATELAGFLTMVDTSNGIAVRADPRDLHFPNTDLTVHLFRRPRGPWLGLDTTVSFGADGVGLTASVLHDVDGPVGRAAQTLTLRRR
jgi:hypothetical protein